MINKKRSSAELLKLKAEAKRLLTEERLTQAQISKKLEVSQVSISRWVRQYGWMNNEEKQLQDSNTPSDDFEHYGLWMSEEEVIRRTKEAKRLLTIEGLSPEQVSRKIGISVPTIKKWAKLYGWMDSQQEQLKHLSTPIHLADFALYLRKNDLELYRNVIAKLIEYLTHKETSK